MAYWFSEVIDQAIDAIYYNYDVEKAHKAFETLKAEANKGNADAIYLLSRCYAGGCYTWRYFNFPEDDDLVERYIHQSILGGSAMGVLGAMRVGLLTPELKQRMPFNSLKEAWDIVYEKAEAGCAFCQNMIGNTYYWLDIIEIMEIDAHEFGTQQNWLKYLGDQMLKSLPWYEKAYRNGMGFAIRNMVKLYREGEDQLLLPQPEKALPLIEQGARMGYPEWMEEYGECLLSIKGREQEGLEWAKRAGEAGNKNAWYDVAMAYMKGVIVPKDLKKALECAEKGLGHPYDACCCLVAGQLYFEGQGGIAQNYMRSVSLFERAKNQGDTWCNDYLAVCYTMGWGCAQDTSKAIRLMNEADYNSKLTNFAWGMMYTEGWGVQQDIAKGIQHLKKSEKEYLPAQEQLQKFKRTWYGKWVRKTQA